MRTQIGYRRIIAFEVTNSIQEIEVKHILNGGAALAPFLTASYCAHVCIGYVHYLLNWV